MELISIPVLLEKMRCRQGIAIEENSELTFGSGQPAISGCIAANLRCVGEDRYVSQPIADHLIYHLQRSVSAAIVDDDDLEPVLREGLALQTAQNEPQSLLLVSSRDDDADIHLLPHSHTDDGCRLKTLHIEGAFKAQIRRRRLPTRRMIGGLFDILDQTLGHPSD